MLIVFNILFKGSDNRLLYYRFIL